jgi:hypothetical protein
MASPADIITYIGVPLAVLGISPILYNFIITFFIRLRLKRQLKALGLLKDTIIQSRFINGVVELELPVYDLYCGVVQVSGPIRGRIMGWLDMWRACRADLGPNSNIVIVRLKYAFIGSWRVG